MNNKIKVGVFNSFLLTHFYQIMGFFFFKKQMNTFILSHELTNLINER